MTSPLQPRPMQQFPKLQTLLDVILVLREAIKSIIRLNEIVKDIDGGGP
jgi:hypothetical protein